ncbi:hypothetical protein ELQ87_38490 [Streptomyces griseoviridis]|uniref:Uncharacterized protein n=1 Tax=Streptomyces griseoviridis TaxID=45398 RepID=A0A3S9ZNW2_STRGD|nr:hypothetical protein ELQ87_38490 [Streptomyces griseoviridis]QCN83672.1 hypothetical protein DDJ31_00745 [Streptomyces griseoviridis]
MRGRRGSRPAHQLAAAVTRGAVAGDHGEIAVVERGGAQGAQPGGGVDGADVPLGGGAVGGGRGGRPGGGDGGQQTGHAAGPQQGAARGRGGGVGRRGVGGLRGGKGGGTGFRTRTAGCAHGTSGLRARAMGEGSRDDVERRRRRPGRSRTSVVPCVGRMAGVRPWGERAPGQGGGDLCPVVWTTGPVRGS